MHGKGVCVTWYPISWWLLWFEACAQKFYPRILGPYPLIEAHAVRQTAIDHKYVTTKSFAI